MQNSGDWAETGCSRTCRIQEIEQRLVVSEHAAFRRLSRDWLFQNMQHSGDWAETGCFRTFRRLSRDWLFSLCSISWMLHVLKQPVSAQSPECCMFWNNQSLLNLLNSACSETTLFQNMQNPGDWAETGCFRTCRIQEIEQRLVVSEHATFRRLSRDWLFQNMQHSGDWAETGCFRTFRRLSRDWLFQNNMLNGVTCLAADCCFSELTLKNTTKHVCLVKSIS
jgi:hypothetical protein